MIDIGVIIVLIVSLWSITITLQKLAARIIDGQDQQLKLLEEIKEELQKNRG
ncbi:MULTISPECIES: hypothetical protein [unclassified Bacillus (in: firmicutes)]|uniref:hypothetical protein n=1 Tax=unclassified Bacillus (in: firmicutes) TaxID=185979 RepID=UPI001BEC7A6F|nr:MULTISPECIES: hypothetical protein [unclassified Bacillus (in: firmicutes)]MBT2637623.1 hypothetical protein [Bacillus sp. ISL-39]MBT2662081.1 hypothetical protein [Bacillus sp. ISL-45]